MAKKNIAKPQSVYQKFDFPDLGSSCPFVLKNNSQDHVNSREVDAALNKIIAEHFSKLENSHVETIDDFIDGKTVKLQPEIVTDQYSNLEIETLKQEAYDKGHAAAVEELQKVINEYKVNYDIADVLREKVKAIKVFDNLDSELLSLFSETLKAIASHMCLILPVDFDKIVTGIVLDFIKKHYERGSIKILVHTTKIDYCKKIIEADSFKDYGGLLVVENTDDIEINGCVVEFGETKLVYSPAQIQESVNKIISELNIERS